MNANMIKRKSAAFCTLGMLTIFAGADADCNSCKVSSMMPDGGGDDCISVPPPTSSVTLYSVAAGANLTAYWNADTRASTNSPPDQELLESDLTIDGAREFAFDARGALYLSGGYDDSIAVYENPMSADGNRPPDRRVTGLESHVDTPFGIAIDQNHDELYLVDGDNEIHVYDISPEAGFDGDAPPLREFTIDLFPFTPNWVAFHNGSLYVADARIEFEVYIFDDPSSLQGVVSPDRTFAYHGIELDVGFHVDASDRMIIANRKADTILMWYDASNLDGSAPPDLEFSIDGAIGEQSLEHAVTDSKGRLYVLDNGDEEVVHVFDDVDLLTNGPQTPARAFNVQTSGSGRLLVREFLN